MDKKRVDPLFRPIAATLVFLFAACAPSPQISPTPTTNSARITESATRAAATSTPPAPRPQAANPTPVCAPSQLTSGEIKTELLDKPLTYKVYLPPCYRSDNETRYPVLYLLHGLNADQDQWPRLGLAGKMDALIAQGKIPAYLVVMPFEFANKPPNESGFERALLELLIPQIDSTYRTRAQRAFRALGGISRGGAWSIYIGTRRPDLFLLIGAHSPAVFYMDSGALPLRLRDIPIEQKPIFYVDAGDNDVELEKVQAFVELLDRFDVPHEWHYNIGFHNEAYWSGQLENYLLWYGQQFASP